MKYYREPSGDYLCTDQYVGNDMWECRAVCIEDAPRSMSTTGIAQAHLNTCAEVSKENVPAEYLAQF